MNQNIKSIRPFIGAENFEISRNFYKDLGFEETILEANLSLFKKQDIAFYLQNAYVKDWIENTMLFIEVENVNDFWKNLLTLNLTEKYDGIKLIPIRTMDWGKECFVHDPSGILWHFGEFFNK
ncbi:VOC family protein [Chryseobacterium limigenitum]|uniref:Catechol 2,3-dioxygenase n=1 Tax=Chryseobacterium limigenitum TaxID=1612149 RepID=A0A1K2IFE3_9FLAO|nr:glyoxalase [Chryseobacterium limigenitum]SFZ90427.1 Catechol 2,3-dioxygenase [Chryseobacterium limigenitum]